MKALLVTKDKQLHAEIATQGAARLPALLLLASRHGLRDAIDRIVPEAPQLVIVDASDVEPGEVDSMERLSRLYPNAAFLLLAREQQQDVLIRAMRAGMREVLQLPLVYPVFHATMDRIELQAGMPPVRAGKVLAFVSCKGGSGATFISANVSHALATLAGKKVLLIDLNGQFGDAALHVSNQKPGMTLSDVCAQIGRMDGAFLASCLVPVAPGFGVLAAADDPTHAVDMQPEHIDAILRVARQHYDYIVLDMGRQIDPMSLRALDGADAIYPVLQLSLADIHAGRRLQDVFRALGYPAERVHLIVNRHEKNGLLHLSDLEQALGATVLHALPNDYILASNSVNQGIPVLQLSRNSAVARSLCQLVELITAKPIAQSKGWFERLFARPLLDPQQNLRNAGSHRSPA